MKPATKLLGLTAACAACCAIPAAFPLLAGIGLTGIGAAAGWSGGAAVLIAIMATAMMIVAWRRRSAAACATAGECGCPDEPRGCRANEGKTP